MADIVERKKTDIAKKEEEILDFWLQNKIFEKTLEKDAPNGEFVFYDGPPFATGLPHYGHILAGTIKDALPRYKTMQGFRVRRKWGWDCHGLPLENQIEEQLGLKTKKDIEEIGIDVFNKAARDNVMTYADDWKKIVPRMGRWVDMEDDYKTMDASYTESVWWVFAELYKKGLVTEGFKSMHLCPRCGTTLSNFEVAQGYKDIKDFSVTVKLKLNDEPNTYLLAWTTTPWTLPGNMAAAVHKDETYVKAHIAPDVSVQKAGQEHNVNEGYFVILGKERIESVLKDVSYSIEKEFKGKELIGKSYTPPFSYYLEKEFDNKENAWKVWHADYVSMEDGTGLVHIAPAFGAEDMELAMEHGIPLMHHVTMDGAFTQDVADFKGLLVKPKDDPAPDGTGQAVSHMDTDIEIIKHLAHNNLLFAKEKIEHSYPHCWRCDTPLLNYAASSWFVTVPKIKDELIAANQNVGWVPKEIRDGRFGKWLEGVRDWAISRSRYWGAPIPVWKREQSGEVVVMGSIADIAIHTKRSGNSYYITRHGESEFNTTGILNADPSVDNPITDRGREQIKEAAKELKDKNIDLIFYSPLQRTRETAEAFAQELGLSKDALVKEERLREVSFGEFEGKTIEGYHSFFDYSRERLTKQPKGGETWTDVKRRITQALYDIEKNHSKKNVLLVSHNGPLQMLQAGAYGYEDDLCAECIGKDTLDVANAEIRELPFVPLPHNEDFQLDLHRPFIDEIELEKDGEKLVRVPDVFDCWFESGSMPYGQFHYPFDNLEEFNPDKKKGFPADFIAEGLDQTRGWFYSMMVLGVALFNQSPYKNVIVNGLVLAEDGKKMSKSLKNYPDPMEVVNTYGADAMRYYLLSSPVVHGDDLSFSEKGVGEVQRKNIGRLSNVLSFYNLYKEEIAHQADNQSSHALDRWVIARLYELVETVTKEMDGYELDRASRPIADFIDDLSTWYLRRSRDRFKGEDQNDKKAALETLRYILQEFSKVIAPFMPFYADVLYTSVCEDKESVHLEFWPQGGKIDEQLLATMLLIRSYVNIGLQMRAEKGIKVRQPLKSFTLGHDFDSPKYWEEAKYLLEEELNVEQVKLVPNLGPDSKEQGFDWEIDDELRAKGDSRELIRHIQDMRKKKRLRPSDRVTLVVDTDENGKMLVEKYKEELQKVAGLSAIVFEAISDAESLSIGSLSYRLTLN